MNKALFFESAPKLKCEPVELSNGQTVYVRQLTVGEKDRLEIALSNYGRGIEGIRAQMVISTVVDEQGIPVFNADDFDKLLNLPAKYLEPILDKLQDLNAVTDTEIEALAGKSEPTPG